jgi:hypothetical protein
MEPAMRPALDPRIAGLLAQTVLRIDPRTFTIAGVPPSYERSVRAALVDVHAPFFVQVMAREVSVVLAEDEWARVRARFPGAREERGYRLLTLDVKLAWDVTGFLSAVTTALADEQIPAGVLSSFHRDHLLVRADLLERAAAALQRLIDAARAATQPSP